MKINAKVQLFFIALSCLVVLLAVDIWEILEKTSELKYSKEHQIVSRQLAEELRRSSDDLTRMVRSYTVTGDERYKNYFDTIIAIRDGKKARPLDYHNIFWDLMFIDRDLVDDDSGIAISLHDMMVKYGFSEVEMRTLDQAKLLSDDLVDMEEEAFNAMSGRYKDDKGNYTIEGEVDKDFAQQLVYGKAYQLEKAKIMLKISEFFNLVEQRTETDINTIQQRQAFLFESAIVMVSILIIFSFIGYFYIKQSILQPLEYLLDDVNKIAEGQYDVYSAQRSHDEIGLLIQSVVEMAEVSRVNQQTLKSTLQKEQQNSELLQVKNEELSFQHRALNEHAIVAITDAKGMINYVNDKFCQISQYSREELLGQNHRILNSDFHPKEMWTEMYRTASKGRSWHQQVCNRAKDGSIYWVDTTIIGQKNLQGKIEHYVSIRADITQQKAFEDALLEHKNSLQTQIDQQTLQLRIAKEQAETAQAHAETAQIHAETAQAHAEAASLAKSHFLANMSHELRTPMHSILSFSNFGVSHIKKIPLEQKSVDKIERFLTNISSSGHRLMSLLDNLLDLAKLESGKMDYHFKNHDLALSTDRIVTEFSSKLEEKDITLNIEIKASTSNAFYDDDKIFQVIANLVSNAIKFTEQGSQLNIIIDESSEIGQSTSQLLFSIYDQGVGIPPDELKTIFNQFIQSSTTDSGAGGTGLGLAICKEIIAAHKGRLWAENNVDKGAVIRFTLRKENWR